MCMECARVVRNKTTNQNERKVMNDKFDELAKGLARSVTRRGALKEFAVGLAGIFTALRSANEAEADQHWVCDCNAPPFWGCKSDKGGCFRHCVTFCSGGLALAQSAWPSLERPH
jgi:hypothetical protein